MNSTVREIPVVFYKTAGGSEVVRDWLKELTLEDRAIIGLDLMRVQFRWPVGMPYMPPFTRWSVGSAQQPYPQSYFTGFVLLYARKDRAAAWVYQENAENAGDDLALARRRKREFEQYIRKRHPHEIA